MSLRRSDNTAPGLITCWTGERERRRDQVVGHVGMVVWLKPSWPTSLLSWSSGYIEVDFAGHHSAGRGPAEVNFHFFADLILMAETTQKKTSKSSTNKPNRKDTARIPAYSRVVPSESPARGVARRIIDPTNEES